MIRSLILLMRSTESSTLGDVIQVSLREQQRIIPFL
jgi:hypothetical protein